MTDLHKCGPALVECFTDNAAEYRQRHVNRCQTSSAHAQVVRVKTLKESDLAEVSPVVMCSIFRLMLDLTVQSLCSDHSEVGRSDCMYVLLCFGDSQVQ